MDEGIANATVRRLLFGALPKKAAAVIAGSIAFGVTTLSLEWPDLLDPQWRTRSQLAWTLEAAKTFVPYLAGCFVAVGVARLLTPWSKGK